MIVFAPGANKRNHGLIETRRGVARAQKVINSGAEILGG